MKNKVGLWFVLATIMGLFFDSRLSAQTHMTPALDKLVKAAAAEKELNYLGGGIDDAQAFQKWERGMRTLYGIDVKLRYTTAPNMPRNASRLVQEFKAGKPATTDLFLGSENHLVSLWRARVLESVNWTELSPKIPSAAAQPENVALAVTSRFPGFTYNTRLVRASERPRLLNDLLDPKWKGKVASTSYAASFAPASVILGDETIEKFLKNLAGGGNLAGLIGCGDLERVVSGEFWILALNCGAGETEMLRRKDAPIASEPLDDLPILNYWLVGVPKNSPHPNLARLFAVYLMTEEAQKILWEHTGFDLHLIEGTNTHTLAQSLRRRGIEPKIFALKEVNTLGKTLSERREKYQRILEGR
jgi:ABC-type Fe3+ transport system substrate-binding protein